MALRDYYRCKQCDAKIAYGPDRPDEDWEPFLLCRECLAVLEKKARVTDKALDLSVDAEYWPERYSKEWLLCEAQLQVATDSILRTQATQKGSE